MVFICSGKNFSQIGFLRKQKAARIGARLYLVRSSSVTGVVYRVGIVPEMDLFYESYKRSYSDERSEDRPKEPAAACKTGSLSRASYVVCEFFTNLVVPVQRINSGRKCGKDYEENKSADFFAFSVSQVCFLCHFMNKIQLVNSKGDNAEK